MITCVQFHPLIEKFQSCLTASEDGKVRLYDLSSSRLVACLDGHFSSVTSVEFVNFAAADSRYGHALSASRDKVLIVWDLTTFAKVKTVPVYESIESCFILGHLLTGHANQLDQKCVMHFK